MTEQAFTRAVGRPTGRVAGRIGSSGRVLRGKRFSVERGSALYPEMLEDMPQPPERLYGIGNPELLRSACVAVVGARKATPYGISCTELFAGQAAQRNATIVSGGALGCDQAAHRAALVHGAPTVVVFGGGVDEVYPKRGFALFQEILDAGGAIVSEHADDEPPLPAYFVRRNRIIAGLARLLLIVEAGLPSGTFTTADFALKAGREVCAVPGAISSPNSRGSNRLIYDGASPVVDHETFASVLDLAFADAPLSLFSPGPESFGAASSAADDAEGGRGRGRGCGDAAARGRSNAGVAGKAGVGGAGKASKAGAAQRLVAALAAQPLSAAEVAEAMSWPVQRAMREISALELSGCLERGRDGRYQVCPRVCR